MTWRVMTVTIKADLTHRLDLLHHSGADLLDSDLEHKIKVISSLNIQIESIINSIDLEKEIMFPLNRN